MFLCVRFGHERFDCLYSLLGQPVALRVQRAAGDVFEVPYLAEGFEVLSAVARSVVTHDSLRNAKPGESGFQLPDDC